MEDAGHPVKGIANVGNTCFFSSMLQAVHQTSKFHDLYVMRRKGYTKQYPIPIKSGDSLTVSTKKPNEFARVLHQTFSQFSKASHVNPETLLRKLGKRHPRFVQGTQEDSHEALRSLLDDLRNEEIEDVKKEIQSQFNNDDDLKYEDGEQKLELKGALRKASKLNVAISEVVQGSVVSALICHECHKVVENVEPFFDLSLPIDIPQKPAQKMRALSNLGKRKRKPSEDDGDLSPKKRKVESNLHPCVSDKMKFQEYLKKSNLNYLYEQDQDETKDLECCLSLFTELDVLDDDNKFICHQCTEENQKTSRSDIGEPDYALCRVSKQLMVHELPPVLILQLKRFEIGSFTVTKDNRYISFPAVLNMAPYCTEKCVKECGDSDNNILYGLYAVVVHNGSSLHCGHYVAYVKTRLPPAEDTRSVENTEICHDPSDIKSYKMMYDRSYGEKGEWYFTDDTFTRKCQFKDVEDSDAYILFYEMLPKKYQPVY